MLSLFFPDGGVGGGNVVWGAVVGPIIYGISQKLRKHNSKISRLPSFTTLLAPAAERLKRLPL